MASPVHAGASFLGVGSDEETGTWSWRDPRHGEHFRRCSYCGSISPNALANEIERGNIRPQWADQKYGWPHKFYVDVINRDESMLFVVGGKTEAATGPYAPGGVHYRPPAPDEVREQDLTPEQRAIAERDGWPLGGDDGRQRYLKFGTRQVHHAKFYTEHLQDADPDTRTKIEMWSGLRFDFTDGKVRWWPAT